MSVRGATGASLLGLAALLVVLQVRPWLAAAAILAGAWTLLVLWLARRSRSSAPPAPTYAIWGRWEGNRGRWLRSSLRAELAHAGYRPASRRATPDILICGPGAPRLAGRVARRVVGVLPQPAFSPEPARWASTLLRRRSWDAVVYLGQEAASIVDLRGDEVRVSGRAGQGALAHALARALIAQARGGEPGAAGF